MKTFNGERKGFVLYFVIAMLMCLAILSFSFSSFKSGSVSMLAKNVDQNRLILFAQAANSEVIALLRRQANRPLQEENDISKFFRQICEDPNRPKSVRDSDFTPSNEPNKFTYSIKLIPEQANQIANEVGCSVETTVTLRYYHEAVWDSVEGYNGFIDVCSKAIGRNNTSLEVKERRDIKITNFEHYLDKYALYVKCFSPDFNNANRRIIVKGLNESLQQKIDADAVSRVYLGNYAYDRSKIAYTSEEKKREESVFLDLDFDELIRFNSEGLGYLFGNNSGKIIFCAANTSSIAQRERGNLVINKAETQKGIFESQVLGGSGIVSDHFARLKQIRFEYEKIVNAAARGLLAQNNKTVLRGVKLWDLCSKAMDAAKNNSHIHHSQFYSMDITLDNNAAYDICLDFSNGTKKDRQNNRSDLAFSYLGCKDFKKILQTFMDNWKYEYGYIDAESVWKTSENVKNQYPEFKQWTTASYSSGLSDPVDNDGNRYIGPYPDSYNAYNKPRSYVGKMLALYGDPQDEADSQGRSIYQSSGYNDDVALTPFGTKVIVEGPVFARFYKMAYLASFSTELTFGNNTLKLEPPPIAMNALRVGDKSDNVAGRTFLNTRLNIDFANSSSVSGLNLPFSDKYLMSHAIDNIPINTLFFKDNIVDQCVEDNNKKHINLNTEEYNAYLNGEMFKNSNPLYAIRRIDVTCSSYAYASGTELLAERVDADGVLNLDGIMYVQGEGRIGNLALDLSNIRKFRGNGLIYIRGGDCKLKSIYKEKMADTLRIVLEHGDFLIKKDTKNSESIGNVIFASLCAFYPYSKKSADSELQDSFTDGKKGKLVFDGQKRVNICGNVLVDYIYTLGSNNFKGLAENGRLVISHDPVLFRPSCFLNGPGSWICSVGNVKTLYSIDASGK